MPSYNQNYERWCKIALIEHFKSGVGEEPEQGGTHFFVEGFERDTNGLADYVEFRLDGPYIRESTKNSFRLYFELNILVVVQEENENAYRINELTGLVSSLFLDCVNVERKGIGEEDDGSLLGCLCLVKGRNEKVQVSHFGRINPSIGMVQASVEGHYQILVD
jgi:hypothetical protein